MSELEELQAQHEKLRLEKRAIDRVTEDYRTKMIEEKRVNAEEIENLETEIEEKKEKVAALNEKNKVLTSTIEMAERDFIAKKEKQEKDYDEKRRVKQKLQFQESKLCTQKVNAEKKCDTVTVLKIQLKELESEVQGNKDECECVKKTYEEEMNREGNILAKLRFQRDNLDKKLAAREGTFKELMSRKTKVMADGRRSLYDKDLLIQRLDFDTQRVEKSIPRIKDDVKALEGMARK